MPPVVLDASAAVEIALWTPDGSVLAGHVATATEVVVPDHFHLECAAALRRLQLRDEITSEEADAALEQVLALRVRRVDTAPLLRPAWKLRSNVTMADALYVVLAQRLSVALVTGDVRLTRAPKLGVPVLTPTTPATAPSPPAPAQQPSPGPALAPGPPEQAQEPAPLERGMETFVEVYLRSQWMRTLPEGAVGILGALSAGPRTRADLHEWLRSATSDGRGLDSAAWDPLRQWTDEELAAQRAEFVDTPFAATKEDPDTAAEVMAAEAAHRQERFTEMDRYAAAVEVAPVRTLAELADLMLACQVLLLDEGGRYAINPAAPLPAEVLPLSAQEAAVQDQLRWQDLHRPTAQAVIRLFHPDGPRRRDRLRTSLRKLARQVDAEVESVRAAVTSLLEEGDFTTTLDVATAREHQVFELIVDWDLFATTRISIRTTPAGTGDDPNGPGEGTAAAQAT